MFVNIICIIAGFILLIKGADFLVDGASSIAKKLHIPEIVIGLTIVSIGTSLPELIVSVSSAIKGSSDMALGNVIGSNISNLLLILGVSAMVKPIIFEKETRKFNIPLNIIFTIVFWIICLTGGQIDKIEGIILIVLFLMFIAYTIYMSKHGEQYDEEEEVNVLKEEEKQKEKEISGKHKKENETKKYSIFVSILLILLGIVALKVGGDLTVDNATAIANMFNISEKIISLTILAVGTSLPELVTSVTAAAKGSSDIAIGNIIGSCIFNLLLIIGATALIRPLTYNSSYNVQMGILTLATIVLAIFPIIKPKNMLTRLNGLFYLVMYVIYNIILFI